jgi:DNA-binding Lrp family transcriptional regulator
MSDIRSGVTALQLMAKYGLSPNGLRRLFRKLVEAGIITQKELNLQEGLCQGAADTKGLRRSPRTIISYPLAIYEDGNPFKAGRVLDVSQHGVRVEGIRASPGEEKTLLVRLGEMPRGSFVFEARCRWANPPRVEGEKWVAGFEIVHITKLDFQLLLGLLRD